MLQKKCVWQVTTIIQPALRHLGTSHFWKVLYNKIPMGQIRWPIFLFFMYMLVLSEKMSIFPKSNMFWILVFSCPKMTLITIFTRMTPLSLSLHCLCIRLCLCICVPYSFLNSFYQKLSENVWVWGSGASWSGDVTMAGQTNNRRKDRATKPMDHGRLRWAIFQKTNVSSRAYSKSHISPDFSAD